MFTITFLIICLNSDNNKLDYKRGIEQYFICKQEALRLQLEEIFIANNMFHAFYHRLLAIISLQTRQDGQNAITLIIMHTTRVVMEGRGDIYKQPLHL